MTALQDAIAQLIEEGRQFRYEWLPEGRHGYPDATPAAWTRWHTRARNLLSQHFKPDSAPVVLVEEGAYMAKSRS